MRRRINWTLVGTGCTLLSLLLLTAPAHALITRLTSLEDMLSEATFVLSARIDELDVKRPSATLTVVEALEGKPAWKSLPVLLVGDARSAKLKERPQLLARLAPRLPVVLFVNQREGDLTAFAFVNGTWFSLTGTTVDGQVRWSWTHLEPYLRRTFKGTSAELIAVVKDARAGKRKPPAPDPKEKPGLGPEVKTKKTSQYTPPDEVRFAVIPTVVVAGPLALLAMLFPTVFGGWQRWLALLSTAATTSTLYTLQWWFSLDLVGSWWGTPMALWTAMTLVNVLGLGWAWRRHLQLVQVGDASLRPGVVELAILGLMSLIGIVTLVVSRYLEQSLLSPIWLPMLAFILAFWGGTLHAVWTWWRGPRLVPALATETVVLTLLVLVSVALTPLLGSRGVGGELESGETGQPGQTGIELLWTFKLPDKGAISSSPLVVGDRVYVAAALDSVFRPYGALHCLDRETGKVRWTFDDRKKMKQVFSSPVVVGDRLYVGEGFHQDYDCKVYCLDASDGKKLWEFQTQSHTEATPTIVAGRLYIGSGDDGLHCLDAISGKPLWQFPGFHVDAGAVVRGHRVLVGCGIGDAYKTTALFCLDDRKNGNPIWRIHTDLPVWSRPIESRGRVFVGMGNGRVNESAEKPAGLVSCVKLEDGSEVWKKPLPDGILGELGLDRRRVYFGCKDGSFYALDRRNGNLAWRRDMGSPVIAGPVMEDGGVSERPASRMYVASLGGLLACVEPATGNLIWSRDLVDRTKVPMELISTPALDVRVDDGGQVRTRLYVGVTLISTARAGELHCYEERASPGQE